MKIRLNRNLKYLLDNYHQKEDKYDIFMELAAYSQELLSSYIFWRNFCVLSWVLFLFVTIIYL